MRRLVALAARHPLEASRQVIVATDVHLGGHSAPALLKTLEEPPGPTVFVLLVDDVTPELATVASRCVVIPFPPVPREVLVRWLLDRGVADDIAAVVADSSGGDPGRARVMLDDPDVADPGRAVVVGAGSAERLGRRGRDPGGPTAGVGRPGHRTVADGPRQGN